MKAGQELVGILSRILYIFMESDENYIIDQLNEYGPYIIAIAATGSIYIGFEYLPNNLTHKLRIGDHDEREAYGYKWQLRTDGVPPPDKQKQWSKYFDDPEKLVTAFKSYYETVLGRKQKQQENTWP